MTSSRTQKRTPKSVKPVRRGRHPHVCPDFVQQGSDSNLCITERRRGVDDVRHWRTGSLSAPIAYGIACCAPFAALSHMEVGAPLRNGGS